MSSERPDLSSSVKTDVLYSTPLHSGKDRLRRLKEEVPSPTVS